MTTRRVSNNQSEHATADHLPRLRRLERLASLLDDRLTIPGTGIRFGLDAVIGLVPGIGDIASTLISLHLVAEAARMGVPGSVLGRMVANIVVDMLVGSIPILGDVLDVRLRANRRNVDLLREHLGS